MSMSTLFMSREGRVHGSFVRDIMLVPVCPSVSQSILALLVVLVLLQSQNMVKNVCLKFPTNQ